VEPPPEALEVVLPEELVVVPVAGLDEGAPPAPPSPSVGPPSPVAQPTSAIETTTDETREARSCIEARA